MRDLEGASFCDTRECGHFRILQVVHAVTIAATPFFLPPRSFSRISHDKWSSYPPTMHKRFVIRKAIDLYYLTLAPLLPPHALADTALQLLNSREPEPC